jgi:hypothetical protein
VPLPAAGGRNDGGRAVLGGLSVGVRGRRSRRQAIGPAEPATAAALACVRGVTGMAGLALVQLTRNKPMGASCLGQDEPSANAVMMPSNSGIIIRFEEGEGGKPRTPQSYSTFNNDLRNKSGRISS